MNGFSPGPVLKASVPWSLRQCRGCVDRDILNALLGVSQQSVSHAAVLFQTVGDTAVIMLVKIPLTTSMQLNDPIQEIVRGQQPHICYGFPSRHATPARGGLGEEPGQLVQPRGAVALGEELFKILHG